MKHHLSIILIATAVTAALSGCMKYSFTGAVPSHLETVAVPLARNQTAEYGVVEDLTDGLVERLQRDNSLKIADPADADAVVRATLVRVEDVPYTYSGEGGQNQNFTVGEYKLTLTVRVEYYDQTREERIWEQDFRNFGTYEYATGSPQEREEGFREAIEKVVDDIVNQMVSGW